MVVLGDECGDGVAAIIWDEFDFIRTIGALSIIVDDIVDNSFVGFVSPGKLVLIKYWGGAGKEKRKVQILVVGGDWYTVSVNRTGRAG